MTSAALGVSCSTRASRGLPATSATRRRSLPGALSGRRRRVAEPGGDRAPTGRLLAPFIAAGAGARSTKAAPRSRPAAASWRCSSSELQAALTVPVWTSSLLLLPELQAALPAGCRVGVVTADAASLTPAHLRAAGADADTPVEGLAPDSRVPRDAARQSADARCRPGRGGDGRRGAGAGAPSARLGAIVLECTNMPPYADAVRAATGLPVHDITTLLRASRLRARLRPDEHTDDLRTVRPRWQFWIDRGGTFTDIVGAPARRHARHAQAAVREPRAVPRRRGRRHPRPARPGARRADPGRAGRRA